MDHDWLVPHGSSLQPSASVEASTDVGGPRVIRALAPTTPHRAANAHLTKNRRNASLPPVFYAEPSKQCSWKP